MNSFCPQLARNSALAATFALMWLVISPSSSTAQEVKSPTPSTEQSDELSIEQARLADRFQRLETVLTRLAELSASTDPRRAKLLREAIAKSRERGLDERFETIVSLLESERLSAASGRQAELQKDLDELLALLLKADRDRELDSQHKRIKAYLKEVGRLIRLEKGLQARTEGGDDAQRLATDQKQVSDQTGDLGKAISDTERPAAESSGKQTDQADHDQGKTESSDNTPDTPSDNSKNGKPADSKSSQPNQPHGPTESAPSDSAPAEPSDSGSAGDPKPSPGKPSPGQPGQSGQPGESGDTDSSDQPPPSQEPTDRAAQRLKQAQQAMEQAREKLENSQRNGAVEAQREALNQLEQAKAELERVLRQLREEEMERTLTLLATRFRKMLDAQTKIYESTKRLDRVPPTARDHDHEIEAARLSREESLIVREADRALVLLREEGSSLAFPETVSLMRDDMQQVAERLVELKVGKFTQQLEQDIIEALEETIAALGKAIKDLEKNKTHPGQSPPAGQPGDPPLVDKIAELKMIRALQMRINRRTQRYAEIIEGEQAETHELLEALLKLAQRQQRVYQATSDLSQGRND